MITDNNKTKAIEVLEEVLDALHEKRYKDIWSIVDEIEFEQYEDALETIDLMIDPDEIDRINKELIEFYEFEDENGFGIDYQLTCCGEYLDDIVLVLNFVYEDGQIKSILRTIDVM